jgi:hypothetical protein
MIQQCFLSPFYANKLLFYSLSAQSAKLDVFLQKLGQNKAKKRLKSKTYGFGSKNDSTMLFEPIFCQKGFLLKLNSSKC